MAGPSLNAPYGRTAARGVAMLLALALVVLTFAAFWPTLDHGLTNWDDDVNIAANPYVRSLTFDNLRWMFLSHLQGHYQPLTWLSYAVDIQLWSGAPRGFHVTNLLLHVATVLGFYVLARQLLTRSLSDSTIAHGPAGWTAAAIAAGVFALHPLRVESVAWATERRDVLSGLFFVATISIYLRAHAPAVRRPALWIIVGLAVYAMALLSKVMVVSLPVVLLVLDAYPLRRLRSRAWGVWLEKTPFFLLGFAASAMAVTAQSGASTMLPLAAYGLVGRFTQATVSLGFYVYRTLVPVNLTTLIELREPMALTDPRFLTAIVFAVAVTVATVVWRRRVPALLAAWVAYCVILVPVSGLFQNGPQIVADRYSYLSCMGFALLIGGAWLAMRRPARLFVGATAGAALVALGIMTNDLSRSWHDSLTLWRRVVAIDPASCLGRLNLAKSLADLGRHDESIPLYQGVIKDRPTQARTHYAYANSLLALGRLDEAIRAYREAIRLQPDYPDALNNLGNALWQQGDSLQAASVFEAALRARPGYASAHFNLGRLHLVQGQDEEGRAQLRAAIESDPTFSEARTQLAFALADAARFADAIEVLDAGAAVTPNDTRIASALALFLATCPDERLRDGRRAVALATRVLEESDQINPVLLGTLAAGHAELGDFAKALETADRAIEAAKGLGDVALAQELRIQRARYAAGRRYAAPAGPG